jgi:hypothetical protein
VVSSIGTIITVAFLALFPVYGTIKIYKNLDRLDDAVVKKSVGVLYED